MDKTIKVYPSLNEVMNADRITLCKWHRFLRYPITEDELVIINIISGRFREFGGMTPEISKSIGW